MYRKIEKELLKWKQNSKMPLMLIGARQTGKTYILEKFAKEILNVIDNLGRAAATPNTCEDGSVKALFDGVELTLKDLLSTVAKFGIEPVGVVGETFNPDLHQAISMQPTEGSSANQITNVLQKGYLLNGRVIRPAMVMVAA